MTMGMHKTAAKWLRRVVEAHRQAKKPVPQSVYELRDRYIHRYPVHYLSDKPKNYLTPELDKLLTAGAWERDPLITWKFLNDYKRYWHVSPIRVPRLSASQVRDFAHMLTRDKRGTAGLLWDKLLGTNDAWERAAALYNKERARQLVRDVVNNNGHDASPQRLFIEALNKTRRGRFDLRLHPYRDGNRLSDLLSDQGRNPFLTGKYHYSWAMPRVDYISSGSPNLWNVEQMQNIYERRVPVGVRGVKSATGPTMSAQQLQQRYGNSPDWLFKGETQGGGGVQGLMPSNWTRWKHRDGMWFTPHPQIAAGYGFTHAEQPVIAMMKIPERWRRVTGLLTTPHVAGHVPVKDLWNARAPGAYAPDLSNSNAYYHTYGWSLDPHYETMLPGHILERYVGESPTILHFRLARADGRPYRFATENNIIPGRGLENINGLEGLTFTLMQDTPQFYEKGAKLRELRGKI